MTKDEIEEGQNLILEFIGYKFDGKSWIKGAKRFCDLNIINDWNYLMRVVDYICDYEAVGDFHICGSTVLIISAIDCDDNPISDIEIWHSGGDDKKRAVFEACVKFIKQINK